MNRKLCARSLPFRITACIAIFILAGCSKSLYYPDKLRIVSREEWGSVSTRFSRPTHEIKRLTIHHGGVYFDPQKDVTDYLINLQSWSQAEKNWPDIPYHYLIDMDGIMYECRPVAYPGDTNTDYNPDGHLLICILGNYEEQEFLPVQYQSLMRWLKFFSDYYNIPADSIRGHKDYTETLCPGKNLYRFLEIGRIREDLKRFE
jgi:hypothetical protein